MSYDALTEALLSKPVGPAIKPKEKPEQFTRQVQVGQSTAEVELRGKPEEVTDSAAMDHLASKGENPAEWEATGFRSSEWTMANGELGVSTRYSYRRKAAAEQGKAVDLDELLKAMPPVVKPIPSYDLFPHGFILALGDTQFGKIDGDGVEGSLRRTIEGIEDAAMMLAEWHKDHRIHHAHIGWLGDHIEGFVSQGGANAWRTTLTLNEQIRLTRRVMAHAMTTFAGLAPRVTMAAVPGNHGEPQRFAGKGTTRYDDSHDTEALIAVSEAAAVSDYYSHVEFYVPDTDEMTVVLDVAGTKVAHAHGHKWRPGKQFDWWRGQAFHSPQMNEASLLLAGHLHHLHVEEDGPRLFVGAPSTESESTWWRHSTGTPGSPGMVAMLTRNGVTNNIRRVLPR